MALTILDATTRTNCYAAADQNAQLEALIANWAGGNVTVRILSGSTLLDSTVYGPWNINADADPYELSLGAKSTRTFSNAGTPTKVVFRSGSIDIFEFSAGLSAGDLIADAAVTVDSDTNLSNMIITANSSLPLPSAPAWTNITSATWIAIPGTSTLQSVDPKDNPLVNPSYPAAAPWDASGGLRDSITAWCGMCGDSSRGIMFQTAQGGHSNYYGNGVYRLSLNRAEPLWAVIKNPSNLPSYTIASGTDAAYSDGTPRSNHGYNSCVYIPGVGPALAGLEGVAHDGRLGTRAVVTFSEANGVATFGSAPSASGSSTGIAACYDGTRGAQGSVWKRHQGTSIIMRWDVATNTWSNNPSQSPQAWAGSVCLAAHPSGDYLLVGNGDNLGGGGAAQQTIAGGWLVFRCSDETYHTPTFTGAPALNNPQTGGLWPGKCQPVWVPSLGCFCAWDNSTSRTSIITITPPASNPYSNAWTVGTLPVDGSNVVTPSAAASEGTYGRFFYWEPAGGFVVINAWNETGYFYKI